MTLEVLLLLESRATGGVTSIASTLVRILREGGWKVNEHVLGNSGGAGLWTSVRRCDVILAAHNFKPAYLGWMAAVAARKPLVVWFHGPLLEVLEQAQASRGKRYVLAWFYRRLRHRVFVSRASLDSLAQFLGRRETPPPGAVIPNAVAQACALQPSPSLTGAPIELAYVGRLSSEKQPLLLLQALRLLPPQFRLTLVGDGPLREAVRSAGADLLASGRLALLGQQEVDGSMYRRWHLTVLASKYEGCPMSLLESLSFGVPCVALPIAGTREVLADAAPSLLAADDSALALAQSIQEVVQLAPEALAAQMARVLQNHRLDDFGTRWRAALEHATRC